MCAALEREIEVAIKTWDDLFLDALCARHGRAEGLALRERRAARFTQGYRGIFPAHEAALDLEALENLAAGDETPKIRAHVYRKEGDVHSALRIKLYVLGEVLPLSASLPIFENLGLKVIAEDAFPGLLQARRWLERGCGDPGFPDGARRRPWRRSGQCARPPGRRFPCRAARASAKATASTGW